MKRNHFSFACVLSVAALLISCSPKSEKPVVLTAYSADSFSSEWGPGPALAEAFFEKTGVTVKFHAPGDTVTMLNQLILEKGESRADLVIGADNSLLARVLEAGVTLPYRSPALESVKDELIFDSTYNLLPYDYGHFSINYDSEMAVDPPTSLEDLTDARFADSLILMDPRTSSPGLGFFLWTVAVYGDDWPAYWERLGPSILTISDGWSQGYSLYTAGEAPLVLSYATSPAYHAEYEGSTRFRSAEFTDGHPAQIEGIGIVAGTNHRKEAEAFVDFILGPEAQLTLALTNIMMPVREDVQLPESFDYAVRPASTIALPGGAPDSEETEALIRRWIEVAGQ